MELTDTQVAAYEQEGYLFVENVFSPGEMAVLEAAMPEITDPSRPEVSLDEVSGTVRLCHGPHLFNEAFRRLSVHPRLVLPARRLLGTDVYLYQSRLSMKAGLGAVQASGWPWHQDYSTWAVADGMREPRALAVFVFLDEVTACNGPLMVIPRSHHAGLISRPLGRFDDREYSQAIIEPQTLRDLARQGGVAAPLGAAHAALLDEQTAELAIVVARGERRHGVGAAMLDALIAELKRRGFQHLIACALRDNTPFGTLAKHAGFAIEEADGGTVRWVLSLNSDEPAPSP